jgi:hypothetical protein
MNNREQPKLWVDVSEMEAAAVQGGGFEIGIPLFGNLSGTTGQDDSFRIVEENGQTRILLAGRDLLPTKSVSGLMGQKAIASSSISQTLASLALPI